MSFLLMIFLLIIGLLLIVKGGDWFVDSSVLIAEKTGIPQIVIGATIVSLGTTLPEFLVTVMAAISGVKNPELVMSYNEIAVNNAIGSMLCNIGLILAIVYALSNFETKGKAFSDKAIFLLITTVILTIFITTGTEITVSEGGILLILFVIFIIINIKDAKIQINKEKEKEINYIEKEIKIKKSEEKTSAKVIAMFILGAVSIAVGAYLLVENGVGLATLLGIPAQIIGVTVIAIGTSLPELVTAITSLKKGTAHLSVGNIIGANVINATLLLGSASLITRTGMMIDPITKSITISVLLLITLILLVPSVITKKSSKWQGVLAILIYFTFIGVNVYLVV